MKVFIIEAMLTRFEFGLTKPPPPFAFPPLPAAPKIPFSGEFPVGHCELGAAKADWLALFCAVLVVLGVCDLGD